MANILAYINKKHLVNGGLENFSTNFIDVINPSTLEKIGAAPELNRNQIIKSIDSAYSAFDSWSKFIPKQRAEYLLRWQNLITENIDELAKILTLEQGKPLAEAKREITYLDTSQQE